MRKFLLVFLMMVNSLLAMSSHIVGGDIYYDYLGNNQYRFYITLYRDCNSTGAQYDNPLPLGVYTTQGQQLVQQPQVPFPGSQILPINFNNPCVIPPSDICVERAIYIVVLTLPPTPGGYTIVYQRCCRGPNITNLVSPDDTGLTLVATIPGSETNNWQNSSPRFTNYPPLLLCNNDDLVFNHAATDPDGDQLVYSLVTPNAGANDINPAPVPPPPPPYFPVNWAGGFSAPNPLGPGATINIDPNTGLLTASPSLLGLFVVGVRVQEFRNGVLIGQTVRDFLFKVFNCNITMQAILPTQEELATFESYCQGLTIQFENDSYGGTNYQWDFGVNGTTSDVSTAFAPSYTYPAPGIYEAMLVVNPGWPCTDTAYMTVNVNNEFNVSFTSNDSICILNNSFDFVGTSDGPSTTTYAWDFGPNANTASSTAQNVNGISFNTTGYIPVTLSAVNGTCEASFTDSIYIFPEPVAVIELPVGFECEGLTIPFGNNSQNTSNYQWDFGVTGTISDFSDAFEPTFTFPSGGVYTVTLIAGSTSSCFDTTDVEIEVNELLTVSFTHDDSLCVTGNSFSFDATVTGPPDISYAWNFGSNATPSSANTVDVSGIEYSTFGTFPVTLTVSFDNCTESASSTVFIFREPTIDFRVEPGPRCAPALVQFTDESVADSPLLYAWNFGDGGTSTAQNPSHTYSEPGSYSVSLGVIATEGCVDTLYLLQQDAVTIHPSPVSAFTVSPEVTDICHPEVVFSDLSQGAEEIFYWFNDGGTFMDDAEPVIVYPYQNSGYHYPYQVAINEFGCRDTSRSEVYIEPFLIYIPNTFTPDGNEFNNDFNAFYALEVLEWEFKIYDRWGELVFETTDPTMAWDGVYMNEFGIVPSGTYAYVLRYVSCEFPDAWQLLTGHVNVLR
ncbi:MAG: PKD domain-containing protein [Bacteroidota bacterium]